MRYIKFMMIFVFLAVLSSFVFANTCITLSRDGNEVYKWENRETRPDDCSNGNWFRVEDDDGDKEYGGYTFKINKIPAGKIITSAKLWIWFDEVMDDDSGDDGDIDIYVHSGRNDNDCDNCIDYEELFDDCNLRDGRRTIFSENDLNTNEIVEQYYLGSVDVTSEVRESYNNNRRNFYTYARAHRDRDDFAQAYFGSYKKDKLEICYNECDPSDICCDNNGNYRPYGYACDVLNEKYECKGDVSSEEVWYSRDLQYCSGSSSVCDGPIFSSEDALKDECGIYEECIEGVDHCVEGPSPPLNPSLLIDNQLIWSYEGHYKEYKTINFANILSKAIKECTPDAEGYCDIPVKVSSESRGTLILSNLYVAYDEIQDTPDPLCSSDIDCGVDKWVGETSCSGNDVWQYYRDYNCVNPGKNYAYCEYSDVSMKRYDCTSCSDGKCTDIECHKDSDCGRDKWVGDRYCKNGDVWQDRRQYDCENAGTINAYCDYNDDDERRKDCDYGCDLGICLDESSPYVCSADSDCGSDGLIGSGYCENGDVWQTSRKWTCLNPGSYESYCKFNDGKQLMESCSNECVDGVCVDPNCASDNDCADDEWVGQPYCNGDNVWQEFRDWGCGAEGCDYTEYSKEKEVCASGCSGGVCTGAGGDADLELSVFIQQIPKNAKAGDEVVFVFVIDNKGDVTIENIDWKLDTGLGGTSIRGNIGDLNAGKSMMVTKKIVYAKAGTYYLRVVADPNNVVEEFDEGNNQKELVLEVE